MTGKTVGRFFDSLTDDYTAAIERCFPRYREMLWATLDYLPDHLEPKSILELGAGTGNLSVLAHAKYPQASFTFVDLSEESLAVCRERLGDNASANYDVSDFAKLTYPDRSFDLILSNISIHHLQAPQKQTLFQNAIRWLSDDGILCFADQCAGGTNDLYERHITNWKADSFAAGSNEEEWAMWMQHQRDHDHHDTLVDQLKWLDEAGFGTVDCVWRYLLWSVIQARKTSAALA